MNFEEQVQHEAKEIINQFSFFYPQISEDKKFEDVKRCALIVIEAKIDVMEGFGYSDTTWDKPYNDGGRGTGTYYDASKYFEQVKQAIINL